MAWIKLTEDHLLLKLSGTELTKFRAVALAPGQVDPLDDVITFVTNLVRGYVGGNPENELGESGLIPDELISPAADLLVMEVMTRAGGKIIDPEGARKSAHDSAISLLKDVAAGRFGIAPPQPAADESEQPHVFKPSFKPGRCREFGRDAEWGA